MTDVTINVTEFDGRVGALRDQAGTLAERLRAAAGSLRADNFAASLELDLPIRSYESAHGELQSRLGLSSGERWTFAELEVYRRPLARMHEARKILDAVEGLQLMRRGTASAASPLIRERIEGVRARLTGPDGDELAKLLIEQRHPINDLWTLALSGSSLDDDRWDSLAQSVEQFFGRSVAIAAIRGHLSGDDFEPIDTLPVSA